MPDIVGALVTTDGPRVGGAQFALTGFKGAPVLRAPMVFGAHLTWPAQCTERYVRMVLTNYSVVNPAAAREVRFWGGWNYGEQVVGNSSGTPSIAIASTTDRYVRITFQRHEDDAADTFAHLAVVEVVCGTMPAPVAKSPDATSGANVPANVVDGNGATWWQTVGGNLPYTQLIIDRGVGAPAFTSVDFTFHPSSPPEFYGIDFLIETAAVLPTASTPDPVLGGTNVASRAVDMDPSTWWQPETSGEAPFSGTPYAHRLVIDRGAAPPPFHAITVDWYDATYRGYDWTWECSDDQVTWRTAATVTGNTAARVVTPATASSSSPPPVVVPQFSAEVNDANNYGLGGGTAIENVVAATWEDRLSEPGVGTLTLHNTNTQLGTDIVLPPNKFAPQVITFSVEGVYAFSWIVEKSQRKSIAQNGEKSEVTVLSGRGVLALWERAVVYPALGVLAEPVEDDRVFDWTAEQFDDTPWPYAHLLTYIVWVIPPPYGLWDANAWPVPWNAAYPDHSGPVIAPVGATNMLAPAGDIYLRDGTMTVPTTRRYAFFGLGDNSVEFFIDGAHVLTSDDAYATQTDSADPNLAVLIHLTAGTHTFACKLTNAPGSSRNPTGVSASLWIPGYPPYGPTLIWHLDTSAKMLAYPASTPGMTPGQIIDICQNEAYSRSAGIHTYSDASDTTDSNGDPWAVTPGVSTKVATDYLTFFREMAGSHIDIAMGPGGQTFVPAFGQWGRSLSLTLAAAVNLTDLDHDTDAGGVNAFLARWAGGWAEITDITGDRVEAALGLGAQSDLAEVTAMANQELADAGATAEQATATYEITGTGDVPYVNFKVGDSMLVPNSAGASTRARLLALQCSWDENGERLIAIPIVAAFA